jgi:hypothetical protein
MSLNREKIVIASLTFQPVRPAEEDSASAVPSFALSPKIRNPLNWLMKFLRRMSGPDYVIVIFTIY